MIFYPWAVLLAHISKKGEMWRHLMRPFGRCRYCNGIWITIYAFKLMFGVHWLILLALGSNFIFVWLLDHYVIPNVEPNTKVDTLYHIEFKHAQTPWQAMMRSYAVVYSMPLYTLHYQSYFNRILRRASSAGLEHHPNTVSVSGSNPLLSSTLIMSTTPILAQICTQIHLLCTQDQDGFCVL
jgi:hypothetical protein